MLTFPELCVEYDSDSTPMPSIHLKHEVCKSGKVNHPIPRNGTHGRAETEKTPNPDENDCIQEGISEEENFNILNKVKGMVKHKKLKIPIFQELLNEYESEISIATIHVNTEPCTSRIPNDTTHGKSETKTAPNLKENGGVEKSNLEDIHLPKSKSYDHGKIAEDDLVIQSPTKIPKFQPRRKDFKFKLNGMIIFTISLLLNNSICTAPTTEQTMTTLGSSVKLNWLFRTDDAATIPVIHFQNQSGSFKVIQIDSGKYLRLLSRADGQTNITLIVNNITATDYGVYRCYLNNQPEEYKDISLTDFSWLSTNREPVISTLRQDVVLSWEYLTHKSINKIIFSRQNEITNHTIVIGIWTIEKGFKQNRVDVSTELVLTKKTINDGGGERISLELQQTVNDDFDKIYFCRVFYDDQISYSQGVELKAERSTCEGKGIQYDKNKSTLTWMYQYRFPVIAVMISRIDSAGKEEDDLGYWYQNKFEPDPLFKDRVLLDITEMAGDRREITLVLINTTARDYNSTYICKVIPADGQFCQCRLELDDDLNHGNYTSFTGVTKPRNTILSSTNSTPIIVVAVIIPLLVVILILTTIFVVRKRCNRQKAPNLPNATKKNHVCNSNGDSGNCSMKEMISLIDY